MSIAGKLAGGEFPLLLDNMAKRGLVTNKTAARAKQVYNPNTNNFNDVFTDLRENVKLDQARAVMSEQKFENIFMNVKDQDWDPEAFKNYLTKGKAGGKANDNIEYRTKAIEGEATKDFGEAMNTMSTNVLGVSRDAKMGDEMIEAFYNPNAAVRPEAKKFAQQFSELSTKLLKRFNNAGGDIKARKDWGLQRSHNAQKIERAGFNEWYAFTRKGLDIKKMRWNEYDEKQIKEMLTHIYTEITTGIKKENALDYTGFQNSKMLANSRQDPRTLAFKDAATEIGYRKNYGDTDAFATMQSYIKQMSQEISTMEILGPNPERTFERMKQAITNNNAAQGKKVGELAHLNAMFNVVTGVVDSTVNHSGVAASLATASNVARSNAVGSMLGGAVISSVTDITLTMASAFKVGINPAKLLGKGFAEVLNGMTNWKGAATEKDLFITRLGVNVDTFNASLKNSRFAEAGGAGNGIAHWSQRAAEGVIRASGLSAWTQAWRTTFIEEFLGVIGDSFSKNFDDLPFNPMLKEVGIDADDWRRIAAYGDSIKDNSMGTNTFSPVKLIEKDFELGNKLLRIVNEQQDKAVLMPDARIRAITTAGAAKGTLKGEVARNLLMFKSFPMTIMMTLGGEAARLNKVQGAGYLAAMMSALTITGMSAVFLKDAVKGKGPRKVENEEDLSKLVFAGFMQGGGLGIFGDLVFSDRTRYGQGIGELILGVPGSLLSDIDNITFKTLQKAAKGDDTNFGSEAVRTVQKHLPGQNLWYTRLVVDRMIFDNIKQAVDPKYKQKVRKQQRKMKQDYNQEWLFPPKTN